MLRSIAPEGKATVLTIPGEPHAKTRPRFTGRGRAYKDDKQRQHENALRWEMKLQCRTMFAVGVAIACIFYRSSRQRVDVDNLLKFVLDSGNMILWRDDMQVTACAAILEIDAENPRTLIAVCERAK